MSVLCICVVCVCVCVCVCDQLTTSSDLCPSPPQGLMFGYATDETREMIPLSLLLAHNMNRRLAELRRNGAFPWAGPDSKSQVCTVHVSDHKDGGDLESHPHCGDLESHPHCGDLESHPHFGEFSSVEICM